MSEASIGREPSVEWWGSDGGGGCARAEEGLRACGGSGRVWCREVRESRRVEGRGEKSPSRMGGLSEGACGGRQEQMACVGVRKGDHRVENG
jgi:hypothetical protein